MFVQFRRVCLNSVFVPLTEEDHIEPDEEDEGEGEDESSLLQEEEEPEGMELDQAPAAIPVPAPDEPPVKRKRGRPPKNAPKPPVAAKTVRVAAKTPASGENDHWVQTTAADVEQTERGWAHAEVAEDFLVVCRFEG